MLRFGQESFPTRTGRLRHRRLDLTGNDPAGVAGPTHLWTLQDLRCRPNLKTGNSTAAHREGAQHTACSQPSATSRFQSITASNREEISTQWDFGSSPPTAEPVG
jgi:hypothetical protein